MTPMSIDRYADIILRRRWLVMALTLLLFLALTAGARFIVVTNDYRSLFDKGNPQLAALDALENVYTPTNAALIAVAARQGTLFTREKLGAIEALTAAAWGTPWSIRVDSLTNYNHTWAEDDDLIVEPLVDGAEDQSDSDIARIGEIARSETELVDRLVSADGRVAGLLITFALPDDRDAAAEEIAAYLGRLLDQARTDNPGLTYYLTGDVIMHHAMGQTVKEDMETLAPIAFLLIVIASAILLRSLFGTLAIVAVLIFVMSSTMGFAGWAGTVLTPANAGLPIIVMTIVVAHSVHIVSGVLVSMRGRRKKTEAIAESLRINAWPVFLTTVTTIIGFLSLNASDSPPFRVLGNLVAFGVFCAYIYSMTLLPVLLSVLPLRVRPPHIEKPGFFDRFGDFVVVRRKILLWGVSFMSVVLVLGISRIELTDNWTRFFDERYEFRQDTDFVLNNLTGMETLEYSLESGREGGITDPDYLHKVEAFSNWYRQQPEVRHVQSFPDIMKHLNKNLHGGDPTWFRLPADPELCAQYLLLYELSLPQGADLNNRIDIGKSATRMTVTIRNLTSQGQRDLDARAQTWLRANAPELLSEASGVSIVFAHLSQRNIKSMLRGTITAMFLISLILTIVFRSVRLGFISLLPNFVPAAMSLGLWGYLIGNLGLGGSIVTAMAFGIIVDDTIHFLNKYRMARRDGLSSPAAVRSTFRTVGHALWTTTAILSVGFLVFASSGFELSWALGALTTLTLGFALLADFLLLPPLLMAIDRTKER